MGKSGCSLGDAKGWAAAYALSKVRAACAGPRGGAPSSDVRHERTLERRDRRVPLPGRWNPGGLVPSGPAISFAPARGKLTPWTSKSPEGSPTKPNQHLSIQRSMHP
jgi:hypothetical protein